MNYNYNDHIEHIEREKQHITDKLVQFQAMIQRISNSVTGLELQLHKLQQELKDVRSKNTKV